jgi:GT2 family glycosyltransferase
VVLNYNNAALTIACVASVLAQDYAPLDVVVVDNCSTDDDYAILATQLPPNVPVIRSDRNGGYAAGNNLGARWSGQPPPAFVMFLNNDVTLSDTATCRLLVAALQADPVRAACSPLVHTPNPQGVPPEAAIQVRRIPNVWQLIVVHSWWLRRVPGLRHWFDWYTYADRRPFARNRDIDSASINGSCFVATHEFLEEIGYLDEGTFLYLEEIILGHQIQRRNRHACLVTSTSVLHHQGATTGHGRERVKMSMLMAAARSEFHYCRRHLHASPVAMGAWLGVRAVDLAGKAMAQAFRSST